MAQKNKFITPPTYKFRLLSRLSFEVYSPVHKKDPYKFNVFIQAWVSCFTLFSIKKIPAKFIHFIQA
jgi:hypothetical protein